MSNVLILEDSPGKLRAVSEVLIRTTAVTAENISVAPDAATARRLLLARSFGLLVLDLAVPETLGEPEDPDAGRRLLEDLLVNEEYGVPGQIIGLTGYGDLAATYRAVFDSYGVVLIRFDEGSTSWHAPLQMAARRMAAQDKASASPNTEYAADLGVVCALDLELSAIERLGWNLEQVTVEGDPTLYLAGAVRWGERQRRIVAALCSRPGMSAASTTTAKLIHAFRPSVVVMPGITAAVRGKAEIGDVIAADECWDWGMGKWIRRDEKPVFVPGPPRVALDADLRGILMRMARDSARLHAIRESWASERPNAMLRLHIGPVASGAAVIAAQEMAAHIEAQHRKLVGIEMEAYGVYVAATEARVPRPKVLCLKSASDFADDQKEDRWQHYAAYTSARVTEWFAEQLFA